MRSSLAPFRAQVVVGVLRGRQQEIGETIGDDAIDLFRHLAIEAAQACLEMRHRNQQLRRDNRRRHRRVHVAGHDNKVGFVLETHRLESQHHLRGLHSVRRRADVEVAVRRRQPEFLQERLSTSLRRSAGRC